MKINRLQGYEEYLKIVGEYGGKGCLSNDYIQREAESLVKDGKLYAYCVEKNAFLFVRKPSGLRLYYYLNDLSEHYEFDLEDDLVIEILYRGERFFPDELVKYFESCGFQKNLVRDQYAGVYGDMLHVDTKPNVEIRLAENIDEVAKAAELFNASFDRLSGDFVAKEDYATLLEKRSILMAFDGQGNFLGALHQTIENNVAWLSHVAIEEDARGRRVGQSLLDEFIERNKVSDKSRYMLWVQHQNEAAVNMYQKKGFKYLGKSTISLLKINKIQ